MPGWTTVGSLQVYSEQVDELRLVFVHFHLVWLSQTPQRNLLENKHFAELLSLMLCGDKIPHFIVFDGLVPVQTLQCLMLHVHAWRCFFFKRSPRMVASWSSVLFVNLDGRLNKRHLRKESLVVIWEACTIFVSQLFQEPQKHFWSVSSPKVNVFRLR